MRLLLVDDDRNLTQAMLKALARQHYVVDIAEDGQKGWEFVRSYTYDLILLDIILPRLDGVSLCQKLRREGYQMPILLLTACDGSSEKAKGLDAGADDYVVKPFSWEELLARIRALLRRESAPLPAVLECGALCLNPATCEVTYAGKNLFLRPKEYSLLELFLRNPSRVFSCGAILEHLWSFEDPPGEETVRAHIKGLRHKLKSVGAQDAIETVYGLGYRWKQLSESEAMQKSDGSEMSIALHDALTAAWEEMKPSVLEQVTLLEQVAASTTTLNSGQRQQAIAEAHKLAGLIGAFGFTTGTRLARKIEKLLQSQQPLEPCCLADLQGWVTVLRQELSGVSDSNREAFTPTLNLPLESQKPPITTRSSAPEQHRNKELSTLSCVVPFTNSPHLHPASSQSLSPLNSEPAKLLIVDDDPHNHTVLQTVLEPWGLNLTMVSDPWQFWDAIEQVAPDLLMFDGEMADLSGLKLCQQVRNTLRWAGLPIVFLTAHRDTNTLQQVFAAGADDFVSKPIVASELVARIVSRIDRNRFWRRLVEIDVLTQLVNRTQFSKDLQLMMSWAERHQKSFCLVLLSLESLKFINYQYGYKVGDAILQRVGELLVKSLHSRDLAARWSGSKFMIEMYGVSKIEAEERLSRLLKGFNEEGFTAPNGTKFPLTFRRGLAQYPQDGNEVQILFQAVETSLELLNSSYA
ncbi:MAG: response regulator [Actinomycetota bacterium]